MGCAGDHVDSDLVGNGDISAFAIGVYQSAALLPVLRGRLDMHNVGVSFGALQNPIFSRRLRIFDNVVGKGEELRVELSAMLLARSHGPAELVVEKCPPAASHIRTDGVKDLSMALVFVEPIIDKISQESGWQ